MTAYGALTYAQRIAEQKREQAKSDKFNALVARGGEMAPMAGAPTTDFMSDDPNFSARVADAIAMKKVAQDFEKRKLENRAIMRQDAAGRAKSDEIQRSKYGVGQFTNTSTSPVEEAEINRAAGGGPETGKYQRFWGNNSVMALQEPMLQGGVPHPMAAVAPLSHVGQTIGSAGDAERAEASRQQQAAQAMAQQQQSPYANASGGGGGGGMSGGGGGGGKVTVSPGGNISRGPTYDDFDIERLRQERARTKTAEEQVPSYAAEKQRNDIMFDVNTGRYEYLQNKLGGLARDERRTNAIWDANTANQPDVWREEDIKWNRQKELFDREMEKIGLQGQNQLKVALAAAGGRTSSAQIAANAKMVGDMRKQWSEAFKTPATSPEEKAMRQKVLSELYQKAQEMGIDPVEIFMDSDSLIQRGPAPPPQNMPATANTPRTSTPLRTGNPGYDALMNSVR
jgi:hypothetical protein